jgi:hypothetical protein
MSLAIEAVLAYESLTTLLHGLTNNREDNMVSDTVSDGIKPLKPAKVSGCCMTSIEGKELALYICKKIIHGGHTLDLKDFSDKGGTLYTPLEILLNGNIERNLAMNRRNDTVHSCVRKTDVSGNPSLVLVCKKIKDKFLEPTGGFKAILAGNHIERLLYA